MGRQRRRVREYVSLYFAGVSNVVVGPSPGHFQALDRAAASRVSVPPKSRAISPDPSIVRIFQRYLDGYRVTGFPSVQQFVDTAPSLDHERAAAIDRH